MQFWLPQSRAKSELVFSSSLDIGKAVEAAFSVLSSDSMLPQKAADIVRRDILATCAASDPLPWPPSSEDLQSQVPPYSLLKFVCRVNTGKDVNKATARAVRSSTAIAEDMCYAATNGKWLLPKHTLLAMSV